MPWYRDYDDWHLERDLDDDWEDYDDLWDDDEDDHVIVETPEPVDTVDFSE
jgi:hypothetical protein